MKKKPTRTKPKKPAVTTTLSFDMTTQEGRYAFRDACDGEKFRLAMNDFYNKAIRARMKYADLTPDQGDMLEAIKTEFFAELDNWGINID